MGSGESKNYKEEPYVKFYKLHGFDDFESEDAIKSRSMNTYIPISYWDYKQIIKPSRKVLTAAEWTEMIVQKLEKLDNKLIIARNRGDNDGVYDLENIGNTVLVFHRSDKPKHIVMVHLNSEFHKRYIQMVDVDDEQAETLDFSIDTLLPAFDDENHIGLWKDVEDEDDEEQHEEAQGEYLRTVESLERTNQLNETRLLTRLGVARIVYQFLSLKCFHRMEIYGEVFYRDKVDPDALGNNLFTLTDQNIKENVELSNAVYSNIESLPLPNDVYACKQMADKMYAEAKKYSKCKPEFAADIKKRADEIMIGCYNPRIVKNAPPNVRYTPKRKQLNMSMLLNSLEPYPESKRAKNIRV